MSFNPAAYGIDDSTTAPFDPATYGRDAESESTLQKVGQVAGDVAAEAGGATAGQIIGAAGGPFAPITVPVGGFLGGGIGNTVAQWRRMARGEQEDFSWGQLMGAAAIGAVPGSGVVKGIKGAATVAKAGATGGIAAARTAGAALPTTARIGTAALKGQVLKAGLEGAGLATAQKTVETVVDRGELPSFGEVKWAAGGGLVFGTAAATLGKLGQRAQLLLSGKKPVEARITVDKMIEATTDETEKAELATLRDFIDTKLIIPKAEKSAAQSADVFMNPPSIPPKPMGPAERSAQTLAAIPDATDIVTARAAKEVDVATFTPENYAAADRVKLSPQASRMMDEYGGVDPKLLNTLAYASARGGAGFVYGSQFGDTPEEKLGNGLAGAAAGMALSPALAKTVGKKIAGTDLAKSSLAVALPEKLLGELSSPLKSIRGVKSALEYDGFGATRALSKALKASPAEADETMRFLVGESHVTNLSPAVAGPAQAVRDSVDELTDKMISSGLAVGELRTTLIQNQGRYLRRAYRVFAEPNYHPDPKDFTAFVDAYVADKIAQGTQSTKAEVIQAAEDVARTLLAKGPGGAFDSAASFVQGGAVSIGKSGELFKPRQSLDVVTRRLLGEITDPVDAANQTIPRMASVIAAAQTQKNLREIGLRTGQFSTHSSPTHSVPVTSSDSKSMNELAGLWTTPHIAKAYANMTSDWGGIWKVLSGATAAVKFNQVILNTETYAPNVANAILTPLQNGHFTAAFDAESLNSARHIILDELGVKEIPKYLRNDVKFLMEQRVLNQSFNFRDLERSVESASVTIPGVKTLKPVLNGAAKVFGSPEAFSSVVSFYSEMKRYQKAFPDMDVATLRLKAAEITRATTTNYSEVPGIVQKAANIGALNTYVKFGYEQWRISYNSARIAIGDMRDGVATGNAELSSAGAKRLAGISGMIAAGSAWGLAAYSKRKAGVSDEQEAALRRRAPPWDANGVWYVQDLNLAKGEFAYSNQSYILPSSIVGEAISSAARGESPSESAKNFALVVVGQMGGDGGALIRPMVEAFQDETSYGRRISQPEATKLESALDRGMYFAERTMVPRFVPQVEKWIKASYGVSGPDGQIYRAEDLSDRVLGKRINRLDFKKRLEKEAYHFGTRFSEVQSAYNQTRRAVQPDKLKDAYDVAEKRRQKIFTDLRQYIADSKTLGQGEDKIVANLSAGKVPAMAILDAFNGSYTPARITEEKSAREIFEEMRVLPADRIKAELNRLVLEDRPKALGVRNAFIKAQREQVLNLTPKDKLIGRLDVLSGERANYFRREMEGMSTDERTLYLRDLIRKRLVTPEVQRQLVGAK